MSILEEFEREDRERQASVDALVDSLEAAIRAAIPKTHDVTIYPEVLARLVSRFGHDKRDFDSFALGETLNRLVGRAIGEELPSLQWLADTLHYKCFTQEAPYDFGYADRYAFSVLHGESLKAFALRTQNINYLVVLEKRYGRWFIHLRQWWDPLPTADDYVPYPLEKYAQGATMDYATAHRVAGAFQGYADDVADVAFPKRLSLGSFTATGCVPRKETSCSGLRYADARDTGYLATVERNAFGFFDADNVKWNSLSQLHYVWFDLLSAIDTMREKYTAEADAETGADA